MVSVGVKPLLFANTPDTLSFGVFLELDLILDCLDVFILAWELACDLWLDSRLTRGLPEDARQSGYVSCCHQ